MPCEKSCFDSYLRLSVKRWSRILLSTMGAALLCCAQAVASATGEAGGPPAQPVTLEEYLRLVARNHPALAAERLQVDAARADTRAARSFANPSVSYTRQPSERQWSIEQPLPLFGQRGARIENAQRGEAAAAAHAEAARTATLDEAARAFNALLVAQARLQVWQEAAQALERAGRIVRGQIEAGARSRYDGARLDLRQAQTAMQVAQAEAAVQESAARVAALAALPAWAPRAEGSLQAGGPPEPMQDFELRWNEARTRLASVRAAQADLDQARHKIELARREALPMPSVGVARVRNRNDGNYTQWGVSVEVPLFDRHQGAIDRAVVEAEQAQLRLDAAVLEAQASLRSALQQVQRKRASVRAYETDGLARIDQLRTMAQDAYRLGQGGILELIDALASIAEHRLEHLDLVKDMLDAEWQLRMATGQVPASP